MKAFIKKLSVLFAMGALVFGSGLLKEETKVARAAEAIATYTISSKTEVTVSGVYPTDSSATYSTTYSNMNQLTSGNSSTLTLKGYDGCKITGISLSMKSNAKKGSGSLSVVAGTTTIASISTAAFSDSSWNGSYSSNPVDIYPTVTEYTIMNDENITITVAATANSLYVYSYSITYEQSENSDPIYVSGLNLNYTSISLYIGEQFTLKPIFEPSNASNQKVIWSSSNESVATVVDGVVTGSSVGDATIRAASEENSEIFAECKVVVQDAPKYELVSDASKLKNEDKIIIVAADSNYAMSTNQKSNNRGQVAINKDETSNTVTLNSDVQIITLKSGNAEGLFAFYVESSSATGYLYAAGSNNNYLKTQDEIDNNASWSISIIDGVASIVASNSSNRNVMQHNSDSSLFSCYASASMKAIAIYKAPTGTDSVESVEIGELESNTIYNYEKIILSATVSPDTASNLTVNWSSSNDNIAKVSDSGIVEAVGVGEVTITATSVENSLISDSVTLNILENNVSYLSWTDRVYANTFNVGDTFTLGDSKLSLMYESGYSVDLLENDENLTYTLGEKEIEIGYVFKIEDNGKKLNIVYGENIASITQKETIIVNEIVSTDGIEFSLVTDASTLKANDRIIIANAEAGQAISTTQASNNRPGAAVTVENNTITSPDFTAIECITLVNGTQYGTFGLKVSEGYLYAASSSKNYMRTETSLSDNSSWSITTVDGVATIVAQGQNTHNEMRFNPNNGSPIFSCYESGQTAVEIYKYTFSDNLNSLISDVTDADTCTTDDQKAVEFRNRYNSLSKYEQSIFDSTIVADQDHDWNDIDGDEDKNELLDVTVSLEDKLAYMEHINLINTNSEGLSSNLLSNLTSSNNTLIVLIVGLLGLTSILGYYFLNKKKYSC